jgi:glucose-6-phosphate isomerase
MSGATGLVPLADLVAQASALHACSAWQELAGHRQRFDRSALCRLLGEPDRYARYSRAAAGIRLDFTRQFLDEAVWSPLVRLARERALGDWIGHLFAGSPVNNTEGRAALHMALRSRDETPLWVDGRDIRQAVRHELERVMQVATEIGSGDYRGHSGATIADVVNIGIGGSDLGLVMATEALGAGRQHGLRTHFVSNIDGLELAGLLPALDPARTLFIICSKSFTTLETRLNAEAARAWLLQHLPAAALSRHFIAVSVNDAAMDRFGIAPGNRLRIWDWVGGRFSLWSAVGLAIAIAVGARDFRAMLDGAAAMDEHFRTAGFADNLPVILGLLGVWNQNFRGVESHAILPYTRALHRFPAFLQQLEMESNGKGVTRDGQPVQWTTGTIVWGEPGSNAQHAFFQLLHQGTARFAADFIAPIHPVAGVPHQHLASLANMLAQADAFARGRHAADIPGGEAGGPLIPYKVHPGGHPATLILLDRLDPWHLGALVALYEHKVFVQSVIWGINPFDQWGVEFGKQLAGSYGDALLGDGPVPGLPAVAGEIRRAYASPPRLSWGEP